MVLIVLMVLIVPGKNMSKKNIILISSSLLVFLLTLFLVGFYIIQKNKANKNRLMNIREKYIDNIQANKEGADELDQLEEMDSEIFFSFLNKKSIENGNIPENGWFSFCKDNFDFYNRGEALLDIFGEVDGQKDVYRRDFKDYKLISDFFANESLVCSRKEKDVCEKINSLGDLQNYLIKKDTTYCSKLDFDEKNICVVLDSVKTKKSLNLYGEYEEKICSVDDGFPGEFITYHDRSGKEKRCNSDGGQIFNIALALVNQDETYCKDIKAPEHQIHRAFCVMSVNNGDLNKSSDEFSEDFCNRFSREIQNN